MISCYMDLRYAIPPLINLLSRFLYFQFEPNWNQKDHHHHLIFKLAFLLLVSIAVLLFLLTSAKLQLNVTVVTANQIRLQAGDFSAPVTVSLLCSVFLPPPHFWVAYAMIICFSPWHNFLVNLLKQIHRLLRHILQYIPALSIICITQQEAELPQAEVELVEMGRYTPRQEQEGIIVVIDRQEEE